MIYSKEACKDRPSKINVIGGVTKIARVFKYFHKLIYMCLKCIQWIKGSQHSKDFTLHTFRHLKLHFKVMIYFKALSKDKSFKMNVNVLRTATLLKFKI